MPKLKKISPVGNKERPSDKLREACEKRAGIYPAKLLDYYSCTRTRRFCLEQRCKLREVCWRRWWDCQINLSRRGHLPRQGHRSCLQPPLQPPSRFGPRENGCSLPHHARPRPRLDVPPAATRHARQADRVRREKGYKWSAAAAAPSKNCLWYAVGCMVGCDSCSLEGKEMWPTPAHVDCKPGFWRVPPGNFRSRCGAPCPPRNLEH